MDGVRIDLEAVRRRAEAKTRMAELETKIGLSGRQLEELLKLWAWLKTTKVVALVVMEED